MNRNDFISLVGIGTTSIMVASYISASEKENNTNIDFTLDLNKSSNSALAAKGGNLISQGEIVAKTNVGEYIPVSDVSSEVGVNVQFQPSSNRFHFLGHNANFTITRSVQNRPANIQLTKYNRCLSGNSLRVYS